MCYNPDMYFTDSIRLRASVEKPIFFSPLAETKSTSAGSLPHWEQSGKTVFVTFRLADSIPQSKLSQWRDEESEWLKFHPSPWSPKTEKEYNEAFGHRMQEWLDKGMGLCLMKDQGIRELVQNALLHFNSIRYTLYAFTVMPNHVHVCFMPKPGFHAADIIQTWKSYSARMINRSLQRTGIVWQREYFDRYVRNPQHFERVIRYIVRNNPEIAWTAVDF